MRFGLELRSLLHLLVVRVRGARARVGVGVGPGSESGWSAGERTGGWVRRLARRCRDVCDPALTHSRRCGRLRDHERAIKRLESDASAIVGVVDELPKLKQEVRFMRSN